MRRNKQKIFNKHSMFKSPALSDRHMMRDLTSQQHPSITSKLYDETDQQHEEESNSIYHEPYRLVLQRNNHSCGRLCDNNYEDLNSSPTGLLLEHQKSSKFGSTPLFNIPPAPPPAPVSGTTRPKLGQQVLANSFSCHEVLKNHQGYAVPNIENFYAATDIVLKVRYSLWA